MSHSPLRVFLISSAAILFAGNAMAQIAPSAIPGSTEPGLRGRQLQLNERPNVTEVPSVESAPEAPQQNISGKATFVLKNVEFEGLNKYSEADMKPLYADKIGQKINMGAVSKIAADVTAFYRNKGYILSRAVVPPQKIEGGTVKIRIVEGFVGQVRVEGDDADTPTVKKLAAKIEASKPLDAATLERYLLLMEDLPGVHARAVIQPSTTMPGSSDVVITLTRRRFEDSTITFDNRGSRFLGPYQLGGSLAVNDLLGLDDQTTLRGIVSPFEDTELQYGEIRHEEQIGGEGTKVAFSASHVQTRPGSFLEPLEIEGQSRNYTAGVSHPFIRSRQSNLFGTAEVAVRDVYVSSLSQKLYEDHLRTVNLGGTYDFVDSMAAINRFGFNMTKGFSIDSGSDAPGGANSRASGDENFLKANFEASRLQPIWGPFTANLAVTGQYGFDALLASEEFAIGGPAFGSAYDPAEITGDSGAAARLELQYNGILDEKWVPGYQLYTFYDLGKVWNRDIVAGTEESTQTLASFGIGTRFNLLENFSGGIEGAIPVTRKVAAMREDGNDPRVFFSLQYRY